MLKEKGQIIKTALAADATLTALLSNGVNGIRPLIATDDDGDEFLVYQLVFDGNLGKDGKGMYQLIINSYSKNYDTAIDIAENVYRVLGAMENAILKPINAQPSFSKDGFIEVEQIYNLKI